MKQVLFDNFWVFMAMFFMTVGIIGDNIALVILWFFVGAMHILKKNQKEGRDDHE